MAVLRRKLLPTINIMKIQDYRSDIVRLREIAYLDVGIVFLLLLRHLIVISAEDQEVGESRHERKRCDYDHNEKPSLHFNLKIYRILI